jgi:hypothetical protein
MLIGKDKEGKTKKTCNSEWLVRWPRLNIWFPKLSHYDTAPSNQVMEIICQCSVDEDEHSYAKFGARFELNEVPSSFCMVDRLQWGILGLQQDFIDCAVFGL